MEFDGSLRQPQFISYLLIGLSLRDKPQDVNLTGRQVAGFFLSRLRRRKGLHIFEHIKVIFLGLLQQLRRNIHTTGQNKVNGTDDDGIRRRFGNIAGAFGITSRVALM